MKGHHTSIHMKRNSKSLLALALTLILAACSNLAAFDIIVTEDPVLSGTKSQPEARYKNVATVNGMKIDLVGVVLSVDSDMENIFERSGNDFAFRMLDGAFGESRYASVKWSFYYAGTNFPYSIPQMALTIDDIDGYGYRWEEISTPDAFGFIQNNPSNVNVSTNGKTISAAGTAEQSIGDPSSAVTFYFSEKNSIVIHYCAQFGYQGIESSVFNHDGNNEFKYTTPPTPPSVPDELYYTYHFSNPGTTGITVDFVNSLPDNLVWDETYVPVFKKEKMATDLSGWLKSLAEIITYYNTAKGGGVSVDTSGNLVVNAKYSNGGKRVDIKKMELPPGNYNLTLRSIPGSKKGKFVNAATITPTITGLSQLTASAEINLP
jgi:hypothetical protein